MNILLNRELVCILAICFVLLAIPLTGIFAMLFGSVAIILIFYLMLTFIAEDSDDDF